MGSLSHDQKKVPQSTSAPVQNQVRSRPFIIQAQPETSQPETPDLQTQLETARRLGHSFSRMSLTASIEQARGKGAPLDLDTRQSMEQSLQSDFGNVRIHANPQADQLNRSIQSRAFTTGQDIFFRQGAYAPNSPQGKQLLGHELTHVVQQSSGKVAAPQGSEATINVDLALEAEADQLGAKAAKAQNSPLQQTHVPTQSLVNSLSIPRNSIQAMKDDQAEKKQTWVKGELSAEQSEEIAEAKQNEISTQQKWANAKVPTPKDEENFWDRHEQQEALRQKQKLKQQQDDNFLKKQKNERTGELMKMGSPQLDAPAMSIAKPSYVRPLKPELTKEKGKEYIGEDKEEGTWRNQETKQPGVDTRRTKYWGETERTNHEVSIDPETGLLMTSTLDPKTKQPTTRPLDTSSSGRGAFSGSKEGRHIFAQSPEGKIYSADPEVERKIVNQPKSAKGKVGQKLNKFLNRNETVQEDIHHSTFLAGEDVAAAGEIEAMNGVVTAISDRSGHYRPTSENIYQTVNHLQEGGAKMVDETLVNAEGKAVDPETVKSMSIEEKREQGIGSSNRRAKVELGGKVMAYDHFLATGGNSSTISNQSKLNTQINLGENETPKETLERLRQDRTKQIEKEKSENQEKEEKKKEGYQF
ncbi:DUF4157 domain-containing protein [Leptolyngbyaceae cyanobacterium UHCC 1019]